MIEDLMDASRQALWLVVVLSAPVVLVALAVGLAVGLLQAASQIQEFTLGFVPKILAVLLVLAAVSPWMGRQMAAFAARAWGGGF